MRWTLGGCDLKIEWVEDGLEGVQAPEATGFGSRIIDEVMPTQVEGEVQRSFTLTGMRCSIVVPMRRAARS